jgi:hypothetical protein
MKANHRKPEASRTASRPKHIEPATAVWVWDGSWWPATVTRALFHRGERLLIVRLEHGLTVPASPAGLEPRDPDLGGADKPKGLATARSMSTTATYFSGEARNVHER